MDRKQNVLAAVVVAGIAIIINGCGGGGGGGGGNGGNPPGGGQTPPPAQHPPVITAAGVNPQSVEGGKDTITVTWTASDADNDTLTAFIRPGMGAPIGFTPTSPTSSPSFTFVMPAVTVDTTTTVDVCVNDGSNPLVTQSFSILVKKPGSSGGGGGGGSPTTAPPITAIDFYGSVTIANVNSQTVEVYANTTGFTFNNITATLDGLPARIVRGFGAVPASFRIELPRMTTAGGKTLAISFPGVATPSTFNILFQNMGDTWMVCDYGDGTALGRGRALKMKTDSAGNASTPVNILAPNGHDNKGFAPGANRDCFWIAGQEPTGAIRIFYCNAAAGTTNSGLVTTGGTNPGDTSGFVNSIASLRDGSKAVVEWFDALNSKGQGANVHWLTVMDLDPTTGNPRVIREIPLSLAGKVAANVLMTPIQTVELMLQQGTTIGGGVKQDWAVIGQQTAPFKLFLVPLESTGIQYLRYDLIVKPQVVECFEDIAQKLLSFLVVGQTGSGVRFQQMQVTHAIPAEPAGFGGVDKGISGNTRDVLFTHTVNGTGVELLMALVCRADNVYSVFNLVTNQVVQSNTFGGGYSIQHATRASGNAWFSVAANNGTSSACHIVQPLFTSPKLLSSTSNTNTLVASEDKIFWEVRGTADNVIVDELSGTSTAQVKPEPSAIAPGNGMCTVSRSLAR